MAQNITLMGASYSAVPAVMLPKTGGGTARFDDTTDANATAGDIASGKTAYVNGVKLTGTGTGGGGSGYTLTNIIPLQTAACTTNLMNNAYYAFINILSEPQTGHMYLVTMDGTEYVCEGYTPEYSTTLGRYTQGLGDIRVAGTYQEIVCSVPFYMAFEAGDNYFVVRGSGTHTIKVDEIVLLDGGTTLGTKTITANGTYDADDDSLDGYSSVTVNVGGGSSKNVQVDNTNHRVSTTTYTDTGAELTVAQAGTYDIYWSAFRSSTSSGTNGTQWYKNDVAQGSAYTSWSNSYCQSIKVSGVQLAKNDVIKIYARSSSTSRYVCVENLMIVQTA